MKQKLGIPSPNPADALMMRMHCPALVREETEIYVPHPPLGKHGRH